MHEDGSARIHGSGEMAELIRTRDWSATPLGPLAGWSDAFLTVVNLMLLSPFAFALYWGEAKALLYNDAYRPFLAGKHPEALGSRGEEIWQEAWPAIREPVLQPFLTGITVSAQEMLIPVLIDGSLQERWWSYSLFPLYEDGHIVGVVNVCSDETPKVLARRRLEESERSLAQMLTATQDAVVGIDRNWAISYLNPRAKQLYEGAEGLVGRNVWEAFPDAVYAGSPYVENFERAMYEGIAGAFEADYPEPLNITIKQEVYPTSSGIVSFSRDVTEIKRATAAMLQQEKLAAVGRLASSIAHEINNPLESVTNLLYLARRTADPADLDEYLATAERELRRAAAITSQTLRFYKQSTEPTSISCLDLFSETLSIYQGRLVNSGIRVEKRKRATRLAWCFEGEIRQVLSNLIGNAIDAMHPQGGRLMVRSRDATHWKTGQQGLALTVADTGTGMPEQVRRRMFEAFYTTKGIGGTGLGLWVSKGIVDRHHGTLQVRSHQASEPGDGRHGTVFVLFLPLDVEIG